jgi:hypothetical protein
MKLSEKDKEFIEKLKALCEKKELSIELKDCGYKTLVLRQNYGDRIETYFGMSRQGVRWRFQRLFNDIYTSAYETVYWVESNFGTSLRPLALEIIKERVEMRKKAKKMAFFETPRRENTNEEPNPDDLEK